MLNDRLIIQPSPRFVAPLLKLLNLERFTPAPTLIIEDRLEPEDDENLEDRDAFSFRS